MNFLVSIMIGLASQVSFAQTQTAPVYDVVMSPPSTAALKQLSEFLTAVTSGDENSVGTVKVEKGRYRFEGIEVAGGITEYEFIVKFVGQYQGDTDICVGITKFFATNEYQTTQVPCDTLAKALEGLNQIRLKNRQ